jgi:hypothetical protein
MKECSPLDVLVVKLLFGNETCQTYYNEDDGVADLETCLCLGDNCNCVSSKLYFNFKVESA